MMIAITGGIGSGKTLASDILRELGYAVIDTDVIAHELSKPNNEIYDNIVRVFGAEYLTASGEIDRKKLGARVFNDIEGRKKLEELTHPIILRTALNEYNEILAKDPSALVFVVIPLLFEGGEEIREKYLPYKYSLLITANDDVRIERMISTRGISRDEAIARIASQMPESEKRKRADFIIENNGNSDELKAKIQTFRKSLTKT